MAGDFNVFRYIYWGSTSIIEIKRQTHANRCIATDDLFDKIHVTNKKLSKNRHCIHDLTRTTKNLARNVGLYMWYVGGFSLLYILCFLVPFRVYYIAAFLWTFTKLARVFRRRRGRKYSRHAASYECHLLPNKTANV